MSSVRPPAVATWLLDRFCADEALVGDLVEEYADRGSPFWYWKEALGVVTVYSSHEILAHKWLAVRAIATGFAVWFVLVNVLIRGSLQSWIDQATFAADAPVAWAAYGRWALLALMYVVWVMNGWVIGRLHRPYQSSMVLAYVVFALGASVPVVFPLVIGSFDDPGSLRSLVYEVVTRSFTIVSLLGGGVLSTYGGATFRARRRAQVVTRLADGVRPMGL